MSGHQPITGEQSRGLYNVDFQKFRCSVGKIPRSLARVNRQKLEMKTMQSTLTPFL